MSDNSELVGQGDLDNDNILDQSGMRSDAIEYQMDTKVEDPDMGSVYIQHSNSNQMEPTHEVVYSSHLRSNLSAPNMVQLQIHNDQDDLGNGQYQMAVHQNQEIEGQFIENSVNGQWIELQPLYQHQPANFTPGLPTSTFAQITDNATHNIINNTGGSSNGPPSPPGQKSGEPDPIIEAIVDGNGYHELKFEIQQMLK